MQERLDKNPMGYQDVLPLLVKMSLPIMIFGLLGFPAMGIRGAAIATLIGQGLGALLGVIFLFSKKTSIEINFKKFKYYGVIFALVLMGIGTMIFQLFPRQLMRIFSDNTEMIEMGVYTLRIISIGYLFAAIGIMNSTYFQALGLGNYSLVITSLRQIIIIIPLAYALSFIGLNWIWLAYPIAESLTTIVSVALQKRAKIKYIDTL